MKKVKCHHRYYLSFGPRWICKKCGAMKKITKEEYKKINESDSFNPNATGKALFTSKIRKRIVTTSGETQR